jgi:2-methylcitrate dehydratase PrpD
VSDPILAFARRLCEIEPASADLVQARILDNVCSLLAGARVTEGQATLRLGLGEGEREAGGFSEVVRRVALARCSEADDIHMASLTTPGAVVIPVAVTLGSGLSAPPELVAAAIASGYEAMAALGLAIGGAYLAERGVWPTYFAAPCGAAAVTARLLQLDERQTAEALGHALGRSAMAGGGMGLTLPSRWLAVGEAARDGCAAAMFARAGFDSGASLRRVSTALKLDIDPEPLVNRHALQAVSAVSVKPFVTAKQCLAAISAMLTLRKRVPAADVESIDVMVPPVYLDMLARPANDEVRLTRIAGAAWNVALALMSPAELGDPTRRASTATKELARVAEKVSVRPDDTLSHHYPDHFPARVELVLGDGSRDSELVVRAPGDEPENGLEMVRRKWNQLDECALGGELDSWRDVLAADVGSIDRALKDAIEEI